MLPQAERIKADIEIGGILPVVLGNDALLGQCVSNLLGNALKFVSPGTRPRIHISAGEKEPASTRLSVKDNGIGIAPENRDRIFRLFERVHAASEYDGTGIGLSIVRK